MRPKKPELEKQECTKLDPFGEKHNFCSQKEKLSKSDMQEVQCCFWFWLDSLEIASQVLVRNFAAHFENVWVSVEDHGSFSRTMT